VTAEDYWGGPRPVIRNVLKAFGEQRTLDWMKSLGVPLKLESTGKYFPVSDQARTVLEALLRRLREVGVELLTSTRVTGLRQTEDGFELTTDGEAGPFQAKRLIVATGGLALPKSGSDGTGLAMMRRLGHTTIPTTPALSPLILREGTNPGGRFAEFSGMTLDVRLGLYGPDGRRIEERTGSMVFTHFGISGPAALDLSRHILRARLEQPETAFQVCLGHPLFKTVEEADAWLLRQVEQQPKRTIALALNALFPARLAQALVEGVGEELEPGRGGDAKTERRGDGEMGGDLAHMSRAKRQILARRLARLPLDVIGDRGYAFAETTAGGVDLREVDGRTMQSRKVPGLFLCGEILDVDGRLGGFNFQWAWASGSLAGSAAAASLQKDEKD
jgi:predicted Rossmann fold flavoprotein